MSSSHNFFYLFICLTPCIITLLYKVSQIEISALIQTTYCIQFERMQFHMIIEAFLRVPVYKTTV